MKESIKQCLYLLDRTAKKSIPFLLLGFLISAGLDVLGIGLVGVFLESLINPQFISQRFSYLHAMLFDFHQSHDLLLFGFFIILVVFTKTIVVLYIQKKTFFSCQLFIFRLKKRLMSAYQYAPYLYHIQRNSNHLLVRIHNNIDSYVNQVLLTGMQLIANSVLMTVILIFLATIHIWVTLLLLVIFTITGLSYDRFSSNQMTIIGKRVSMIQGEVVKNIKHGLSGLIEARVFGKENFFIERLSCDVFELAKGYSLLNSRQLIPRYLIENVMVCFVMILCFFGVFFGENPAGIVAMVGMFVVAGVRLMPAVTQVLASINQIRAALPNMHLVYKEFKDIESLMPDSEKYMLPSEHKLSFFVMELVNCTYQYPHALVPALQAINLRINRGQAVGLIGHSGAGKSTVVNIILGLLKPQSGHLLVDGEPMHHLRHWLNNFAYIPQTIFMLDDTLKRNIAFGVEDALINEVTLWNALEMAQLTEVVTQLPEGIHTMIGEQGIRLSGGQRQRVALARAFYHDRDVIILDEATSSLDHETEAEIIHTMKRLKGKKTLIVIAHRLTTVQHCDVLYKLDHGCIQSTGTFLEVVGE